MSVESNNFSNIMINCGLKKIASNHYECSNFPLLTDFKLVGKYCKDETKLLPEVSIDLFYKNESIYSYAFISVDQDVLPKLIIAIARAAYAYPYPIQIKFFDGPSEDLWLPSNEEILFGLNSGTYVIRNDNLVEIVNNGTTSDYPITNTQKICASPIDLKNVSIVYLDSINISYMKYNSFSYMKGMNINKFVASVDEFYKYYLGFYIKEKEMLLCRDGIIESVDGSPQTFYKCPA